MTANGAVEAVEVRNLSRKRRLLFFGIGLALVGAVTFVLAEVTIRLVSPQASLFPRFESSRRYGFELYENVRMVHEMPGRWQFIYTTNQYRYRGTLVPVSNGYETKNVVVLGDSLTFGQGVNDPDIYSEVMRAALKPEFDVINLGVGGWGLTQQIRRFYEFGQVYDPRVVVMQFSSNDPQENFANQVTTIENGRFKFNDAGGSINWIRRYLSDSVVQKSQVYNLFRVAAYGFLDRRIIDGAKQAFEDHTAVAGTQSASTAVGPEQRFHSDLLELFATDLSNRGIPVIMIAVTRQLNAFPHIERRVRELEAKGVLRYVPTTPWFDDETAYRSPEGHLWGAPAHRIIGTRLAGIVKSLDAERSRDARAGE